MKSEKGAIIGVHFVRHGQGNYVSPDFIPPEFSGIIRNRRIIVDGYLVPEGIGQVDRTANLFASTIGKDEEVYILVSPTGRTLETVRRIHDKLRETGINIQGLAITEELGEAEGFSWREFSPLVYGGTIVIDEESVTVDAKDSNPQGLDPRRYFIQKAWTAIPPDVVNKWPEGMLKLYNKIETYHSVTRRAIKFIERLITLSNKIVSNKRFLFITHDALLMYLTQLGSQQALIGVDPAGFLSVQVQNGGSIIHDINGDLISDPEINPVREYSREFINATTDAGRYTLWKYLRTDLENTIYAACNLGTFHPPFRWVLVQDGKEEAVIGIYRDYRFFTFGNSRLIMDGFTWIKENPDKVFTNGLPEKITLVAPYGKLLVPEGFIARGDAIPHKRLFLPMKDLEKPRYKLPKSAVVRQLKEADIPLIKVLVTPPNGEDPEEYKEGVHFNENRLKGELPYFGLFIKGKLVSIAGTHGLVPDFGIAVVGDAFTLPSARQRNFATLVTYALLKYLDEKYDINQVGTDIRDDKPGFRVFTNLGFIVQNDRIYYLNAQRV